MVLICDKEQSRCLWIVILSLYQLPLYRSIQIVSLFNIKSSSLGPGSTVVEKGKTRGQIKTKNKQGGKTP